MSAILYIALIDGISTVFATSEAFTLAMAEALGFESVHYGLQLPSGLEAKLNLRTGELDDTTATINIADVDGSLAGLFGAGFDSATALVSTLAPGATAGASLYNKHVGIEAIGPAGERRQFSCVPGWSVGLRHLGEGHAFALGLPAAPVSDVPILWPGRRVCVYRLREGASPSTVGRETRVWWGTLLGQGTYEGKSGTWSFKCAGPESWIMGNLGVESPDKKLPVLSNISLEGDELILRGNMLIMDLQTGTVDYTYIAGYIEDNTYLAGAVTYADVAAALDSFLADIAADNSLGAALNTMGASSLSYSTNPISEGVNVRWDAGQDLNFSGNPRCALRVIVWAHEKVWQALGYDVHQQNPDRSPVENADQFGLFAPAIPLDIPRHWSGHFFSGNGKAMASYLGFDGYRWEDPDAATDEDCYSFGFPRQWPPLHLGGGNVWWMDETHQEFRINTLDPLYLVGSQTHWLLESKTDSTAPYTLADGAGQVNRQGIMCFVGPYRRRGDDDGGVDNALLEKERREGRTKQVARVCWRENSDGSVSTDSEGFPRFVISQWLDPRLYGVDWPKLTGYWGTWANAPKEDALNYVVPLVALEAAAYAMATERASHVMHATWAATGTGAGFTGTADNLTIDVGDNASATEIAAAAGLDLSYRYLDIERADLGCGVPSEMIGDPTAIDGVIGSHLERVKACFMGQLSARKLFASLLSPIGACMSLAGGQYQLFDPWNFKEYAAAGVLGIELSEESIAGDPGDPSSCIPIQSLRTFSPIDLVKLQARVDPTDGKYAVERTDPTSDIGARYRQQTITQNVNGSHLINPLLTVAGANWSAEYQTRWRIGTRFWSEQHFTLTLPYSADDSIDFWPGQPVVITDPWAVDPVQAQYGLSLAFGYVIRRSFSAQSETVEVELLVSSRPVRLYAPAVSCTRYDENNESLGYRLFVESSLYRYNLAGDESFASIMDPGIFGFQPPGWYPTNQENTDIEIFQFDGVTWTRGIYGTVSSITAGDFAGGVLPSMNPSGWLNLTGALTGNTFYRDMHHIVVLRDAANQSAGWVADLFGPVCDSDGTFNALQGKKFI